jgi:hypothetical protein
MSVSRALLVAATLGAAGCFPEVDVELPADYQEWDRIDAIGALPAHGDTYRIIYVNDLARGWSGSGRYPVGSTLVKEVHHRDRDQPAGLSYVAVMRRLDRAPDGGELHDGWLYTYIGEPGGAEEYRGRCYRRCHVAAPFAGLFLDYGFHSLTD